MLLGVQPQSWSDEPLRFPGTAPVAPAEAEKTFEVLHGFQMQLIAAEPLVCDPVAITYDADGRAYVCEMSDYPYTDKAHHKASQENPTDQPIGKIRLLVDTDGDGVFDKATVFAEGLSWPTGSACWKGGIIVVATPDIWYFKDTDGDGVADVRQKLFTGLKKLNIQAVANNPIWGLDNKISIAGGSNGGTLQNLVHPEEKLIAFRRNDLVLDPEKMTIELASGGARFGNTRDDWGNRFLCNIRNPLEHVVIGQRHLARNPYLPPLNPLHDVAESGDQLPVYRISPPEAWREFRAKRWSGDSTVAAHMPRSELVGAGVVTSSSGCTIYRGDAYPREFYGNAFVADVAGNLFYRLKLEPEGVTFKGTRVDGKKEMVASRDLWFRPVNFANAPDGTLTVCDMYREVIEHPWSLPDDIHAALDLERGRDKGRLYRLAPPAFAVPPSGGTNPPRIPPQSGTTNLRPTPQLSQASTHELIALLAHPNAWHRDTAHRLLLEKQDPAAVAPLRDMAEHHGSALARAEAFWVLQGIDALTPQLIARGLNDTDPNVRGAAASAGEPMLAEMLGKSDQLRKRLGLEDGSQFYQEFKAVLAAYQARAADASLGVRFQATLAVGAHTGGLGVEWKPLAADLTDPGMRLALLSSNPSFIRECIPLAFAIPDSEAGAEFVAQGLKSLGPAQDPHLTIALLEEFRRHESTHPLTFGAGLRALFEGPLRTPLAPAQRTASLHTWLDSVADRQSQRALEPAAPIEERERAVALLVMLEYPRLEPIAAKLLQPAEPDAVRVAAIKLLGQQKNPGVAKLLLDAWPTLTPAPREAALQAIAARPPLASALLSALEQGRIKPAEISPTARTLLTKTSDPRLRERASKLFAGGGTRAEVIAKYQSTLTLKGDAEAGHKVYQAVCAACHRKGDEGRDLGPNLATVLSWTPEQLLANILDPNREVSPNFVLYVVETRDGRSVSGLITSETGGSLGLKGADGTEQTVSRADVKSLQSTGLSLMPEGLEAALTPRQMADVIAFIRGS